MSSAPLCLCAFVVLGGLALQLAADLEPVRVGERDDGMDRLASGALFQVQGTLGQVTTQADAHGNWTVTLTQDAPVRGADLTISATAVDQSNRRSQPTTVAVKQGG